MCLITLLQRHHKSFQTVKEPMRQANEVPDDWQELLCKACVALSRTSEDTISAITVTLPISDDLRMLSLLTVVSKRLSEEYGLYALVEQEGYYFNVRFSRSPSSDIEDTQKDSVTHLHVDKTQTSLLTVQWPRRRG